MRVAFVEPSIASVEPLGIASLIQVLLDEGHTVAYFEAPRKGFERRLADFAPQVLAYSVTTGKHRLCRDLNERLRASIRARSFFGGPHCTFYPEFIESSPLIDGVCRGEGDVAFPELLRRIARGESPERTENWWLRSGGTISRNEVRDKVDDLDRLPFPNREIIYAENEDLRRTPIKRIIASRGCPYSCSYCFNSSYNALYRGKGRINRHRSPANIVAELAAIKSTYPFAFLKIVDDTFGLKMDYREFADLYRARIGLPFLCNVRPNLLDEEKIRLLKHAGCVAVTMAVESGDEYIRNKVLNRNLDEATMSRAINSLKNAGLRVYTQNIIGNPGESFDMALATLRFNVRHKVDFAECFLLTPFYGTGIYEHCVKNDLLEAGTTQDTMAHSYWLGSCIRFDSLKEKNRFVNFHKLFSLGVAHPRLLPLIMRLIKLPPNRAFVLFNRVYDAWRIGRVVRVRMDLVTFVRVAKMNLGSIFSFFLRRDRHSGL